MILARRSRSSPSRSAAARVSAVDWPLAYSTRAKVRTRSDRSCKLRSPGTALLKVKISSLSKTPPPRENRAGCYPRSGIVEARQGHPSGSGRHIGFHHLSWIDDALKFSLCDKAQL